MLRVSLRSLLGRKVRLLMSTFAIVLGVSFVVGTLVFSDTLQRSFDSIFASSAGDVVVRPDGQGGGPPGSRTVPSAGSARPPSARGGATLPPSTGARAW